MTLAEYRRRRGEETAPEEEAHLALIEKHPGPVEYAQIGGVLAFITALEVGLYYLDVGRTILVLSLLAMSGIKFSLVVLWFMHLKFDNRLFSSLFVLGFFLALSLFVVVLATIGGKLV